MRPVFDDSMLDSPDRLTEVDTAGLLRSAALGGAQIRSTVEAAEELDIPRRLEGIRPRALVLLARPGSGPTVMRLLGSLLGPSAPVPLVIADVVPSWIGALDVVFAHADNGEDPALAESIARAAARGARIVVTAPEHGPVAAAAAGRALHIEPRISTAPGFDHHRALAGGLVTLRALDLLRPNLAAMADALDREAERGHPMHESFVNPAKALALRLADRTPLLWGMDPVATAVAAHAALVLAGFAGMVADVAGYPQVVHRPALHRAAVSATSGADIFSDPEDNVSHARVLLLAVADGREEAVGLESAEEAMPGADLLTPAEEIEGDEATRAAVLCVRFDLAAVYLGLASGLLGGPGLLAPTADHRSRR